jgi:hypothetical protein
MLSCETNSRIDALEEIVFPLMRLAGDRVPEGDKFQMLMYSLRELHKYKFESKNVWGPHDELLARDMGYFVGKVSYNVPGREYTDADAYKDRQYFYQLTDNGKFHADIHIKNLQDKRKQDLELIQRVAKASIKFGEGWGAGNLYRELKSLTI